jgi:homoserine kinase
VCRKRVTCVARDTNHTDSEVSQKKGKREEDFELTESGLGSDAAAAAATVMLLQMLLRCKSELFGKLAWKQTEISQLGGNAPPKVNLQYSMMSVAP